jgi:glycosyltransferase involved in cell wall biosynthesis
MQIGEELIVVDSGSTDKTIHIANSFEATCLRHDYENSAKQKNWAMEQARGEWVLFIDSDEVPESGLMEEVRQYIHVAPDRVELVLIPRKNLFWGVFMDKASAYPDLQSRLVRRGKGQWEDKEVHARMKVQGQTASLVKSLIHYDFTSISSWWLRNNRYFRYELDQLKKEGRRWSRSYQYARPLYVFFKFYFMRGGFKHGFRGFFISFQWMVYCFMVAAKLYEDQMVHSDHKGDKGTNPW